MNKDQKKTLGSAFLIAFGLFLVGASQTRMETPAESVPLFWGGAALLGFGIYQMTQINREPSSAGTLYCKKCGEQIGTQDQFCANCGTGIVLGFKNVVSACECGAEILEGVKFCRQCSRKVG